MHSNEFLLKTKISYQLNGDLSKCTRYPFRTTFEINGGSDIFNYYYRPIYVLFVICFNFFNLWNEWKNKIFFSNSKDLNMVKIHYIHYKQCIRLIYVLFMYRIVNIELLICNRYIGLKHVKKF